MLNFVLFVLSMVVLVPFVVRRMASNDICFSFPASNHIKYVERGGSKGADGVWQDGVFDHPIPEIPGKKIDGDSIVDGEQKKSLLHELFGIYFYGLYPFKHVKNFRIKKVRENIQGTGPRDWVTESQSEILTGLRFRFPRPFVFTDVELKDKFTIHLKVVAMFEVVNPYTPMYIHGSDFFTPLASLIQGQVIDLVKQHSINDFVEKSKGEIEGILQELKQDNNEFNKRLIELVGLKIVSISINDYEPPAKIAEAIQQQALAEEQGKASVTKAERDRETELINADRDAKARLVRADAEAKAQDKLTEARGRRIRETVASMASSLGDPNTVAVGAASVLEMEAATGETSKLTTLVKDRSSVVVPVGGDKK